MKIPILSTFVNIGCITTAAQNGQSEPECVAWTNATYAKNEALILADENYTEFVKGAIEANCIDHEADPKKLKACNIGIGGGSISDAYSLECEKADGRMWKYDYYPKCSNSVSQTITNMVFCASSNCTGLGVVNLIPDPSFLDPFTKLNYTCGTGFANVQSVNSGAGSLFGLLWITASFISAYILN
mmetsp:Transcript_42014/g.51167  ORF Transcript_42014/g.51167 Transcript_42014/m.51167 type:complete len:186 (+) Transcript_42014:3-560(+)